MILHRLSVAILHLSESLLRREEAEAIRHTNHPLKLSKLYALKFRDNACRAPFDVAR